MGTVLSLFGVQPIRVGGTEIYTRELTLQLAEHGWRHVAVFSGEPSAAVREYFADLPGLTVPESIPEIEHTLLGGTPAVWKTLSRYKPEILHFQFTNLLGPFPWLGRLRGVQKTFFTSQGSAPTGFEPTRAAAWKRAVAGGILTPVTKVLCISDYVRRIFETSGLVPKERLHRLYNAVYVPGLEGRAEQGVAFRKKFGIPPEKELVVQVSAIIPEKGIEDLLEAAKIVVAERPDAHFAIAGNGDSAAYQQMARSLGISNSVTWCGLINNAMEEGIYPASDVFCLLSRWEEAFGWVLAEAMSFERPVVGTLVGAIPEVVSEGVTGLLGPRNDPGRAAQNLLRLLSDRDLRRRMGVAGRERVQELFDLKRNVRELIGLYGISGN